MDQQDYYDAASFTIVSKENGTLIRDQLEALRSRSEAFPEETNVIVIAAMIEHGMYFQAEENLRKALERSPDDQALWALLMETYFNMKLWGSREDARFLSEHFPLTSDTVRKIELRR